MSDNNDELFKEIFRDGGPTGPEDPRLAELPPILVAMLTAAGPGRITPDGQVVFHEDSPKISLPNGMGYGEALKILKKHQQDAETPTSWDRQYLYRPDDGAYATHLALQELFGSAYGESREFNTFFGKIIKPAETREVATGLKTRVQVAWGEVSIPRLPGLELDLDVSGHREYGRVFHLSAEGPRKYKDQVQRIFDAVEEKLRTNSIYRGQALTGSNELLYFDLEGFDPSKIIFSDLVHATLEAKLWSALRYPDMVEKLGVSLKRAVLLHGPFGTGKTSAALITGQVAVQNGWTFLSAKTGDDIRDVLRTARLYEPAVVFYEDVDREASNNDADGLAQLLEAFDGITTKTGRLIMVMTTNHSERIAQGMLRPGRFDAVVKIAELDRGGTQRLIETLVPAGKLRPDVDFDRVFKATEGYLPAFLREVVSSALLFAMSREKGNDAFVIDTDDLVAAAQSLRAQYEAHTGAAEGVRPPTLDRALAGTVQSVLNQTGLAIPHVGVGTFVEAPEKAA